MALVSIIIINSNYARFLPDAIDSALRQTGSVTQVIVVDDGSTDNSRSIIAGYGDRVLPVLKPRGGHVSAFNAGFEKARGDLCIFLDADDVLLPECAQTVAEAWTPEDVKVQYRLATIDAEGVDQNMPFPHYAEGLNAASIREQALESSWYPWPVSSGNAFSRQYLERLLPIDAEVIYRSPDGYLNKLAPLYGDVRSLPIILGAYRVHDANTWAKAGNDWTPDTAICWLNFDKVLQTAFLDSASAQGYPVRTPLRPSLQQLEYRTLVLKFARDRSPYLADTSSNLLRLSAGAVLQDDNISLVGRLFWLVWFSLLLYGPSPFIRRIFSKSRGQIGRASLYRWMVNLSKGGAKLFAPPNGPRSTKPMA